MITNLPGLTNLSRVPLAHGDERGAGHTVNLSSYAGVADGGRCPPVYSVLYPFSG